MDLLSQVIDKKLLVSENVYIVFRWLKESSIVVGERVTTQKIAQHRNITIEPQTLSIDHWNSIQSITLQPKKSVQRSLCLCVELSMHCWLVKVQISIFVFIRHCYFFICIIHDIEFEHVCPVSMDFLWIKLMRFVLVVIHIYQYILFKLFFNRYKWKSLPKATHN